MLLHARYIHICSLLTQYSAIRRRLFLKSLSLKYLGAFLKQFYIPNNLESQKSGLFFVKKVMA